MIGKNQFKPILKQTRSQDGDGVISTSKTSPVHQYGNVPINRFIMVLLGHRDGSLNLLEVSVHTSVSCWAPLKKRRKKREALTADRCKQVKVY